MDSHEDSEGSQGTLLAVIWGLDKDLPDQEYTSRLNRGLHSFFSEHKGIRLDERAKLGVGKSEVIISIMLRWDDDREMLWVSEALTKHLNSVGLYSNSKK